MLHPHQVETADVRRGHDHSDLAVHDVGAMLPQDPNSWFPASVFLIFVAVLAGLLFSTRALSFTIPINGLSAISAGGGHTCALTTSGGAKCWGSNSHGQLGTYSASDGKTPDDVFGLTSGVIAISAGISHSCAVTSAGAALCWGSNGNGELGNIGPGSRTPVPVYGLTSGVVAISAGNEHTCALLTGGAAKCWGRNSRGQLGNASTTSANYPVDVLGLSSNVDVIVAGKGEQSCAIHLGAAKCWGANDEGQLGDGTQIDRSAPVGVTSLVSGIYALGVGYTHGCALHGLGEVKCWGANNVGQLGDGSNAPSLVPVSPSGPMARISSLGLGSHHTCVVNTDAQTLCWGKNSYGQAGDESLMSKFTPTLLAGAPDNTLSLSGGEEHTCAILGDSTAMCWGDNSQDNLGTGYRNEYAPVAVHGMGAGVASIGAGVAHSCAVRADGSVRCWGSNDIGQLGDGTHYSRSTPTNVGGLGGFASDVSTRGNHTCVLTLGGAARCWGSNESGQLGIGDTADSSIPVTPLGLGSGVSAIAAGGHHTCAIVWGVVNCWGRNSSGQLGDNTTTGRLTPTPVSNLTGTAIGLAAGDIHTCALLANGAVRCWGNNYEGQIGDGTGLNRSQPTPVVGLDNSVTALVAGDYHNCAITSTKAVVCWGESRDGELGNNRPIGPGGVWSLRRMLNLPRGALAVAGGTKTTCVIDGGGGLLCTGSEYPGGIGDDYPGSRQVVTPVLGLDTEVLKVSVGGSHACALTSVGAAKCWGSNWAGQLGNGVAPWHARPAPVVLATPSAPRIDAIEPENTSVTIWFMAPRAAGTTPIDRFRVSCAPGGASTEGNASPITVTGLTIGTSYRCTGAARNTIGWSAESTWSASVTPAGAAKVARGYVSALSGSDSQVVNGCSRNAPCRTLAASAPVVADRGELIILDEGEFGPVTLRSSISIVAAPGKTPSISPGSAAGILVAAPGARVALRGLRIDADGGEAGIVMAAGSGITIEDCFVSGFPDKGIAIATSAAATIFNTTVEGSGVGVSVGNNAKAAIINTRILDSAGITLHVMKGEAFGSANTRALIRDSLLAGRWIGLQVDFGGSFTTGDAALTVHRSRIVGHSQYGVVTHTGSGVNRINLSRSLITGNGVGIHVGLEDIYSAGNNAIRSNGVDVEGTLGLLPPM